MAVKVLKSRADIALARKELRRRKLSSLTRWPLRTLRRRGLVSGVCVGDYVKSWDILTTAEFLVQSVDRSAPILDLGAYASENLCVLRGLNYAALTGVDLNPNLTEMPYSDSISYQVSNFMHTPFDDQSFAAVTAISVIEHGFQREALLTEISRLLRPGGYFISSFDYWPDKVDTTGIKIFDMDWTIFSKDEVLSFIDEGKRYGLSPRGEIDLDAKEQTIETLEKGYTFAWMALRKE